MSPTHDWFRTPLTADVVRGALEPEATERGVQPHRLPAWARAQGDAQLSMVESQPAGVRLAFRTAATVIELDAHPTRYSYVGAPARPDGVYDLVVDGRLSAQASVVGGTSVAIDMATGVPDVRAGEPGTIRFADLEPREKDVELWLPHNETTELVELRTDAPVAPLAAPERPTWVHHGSSISHGSNATSPSETWPALAAAVSGVELVNLGFGGSAMLDPFVARVIRDVPADLISVKIGINLVNADVMRQRAFGPAVHGFLDTIRDGHPDTPLVVVSPIYCPIHEDTPGPGAFDMAALAEGRMRFRATGDPAERAAGKLTLRAIRDELERIVAQRSADDPHLSYVNGLELYGEADFAEVPLPDALHPDTAGHARIGARFAERALAQPPAGTSGPSGTA